MILKLLERFGRKAVLVDFYGRVRWERWYLFFYEDEGKPRWWMRLPNVWIHHFIHSHPDAEDQHRHPFSTASLMLKGGYREVVNGQVRSHRAFGVALLSYRDKHRVDVCEPNSWSIFAHGPRRGEWAFENPPCASVCRACEELNGGSCAKLGRDLSYEEQFERAGGAMRWERVGPDTEKRLARRRAAIERMGIRPPESRADNKYAIISASIKR